MNNNSQKDKNFDVAKIIYLAVSDAMNRQVIPGMTCSWEISFRQETWGQSVDDYIEKYQSTKFQNEIFFNIGHITVSVYGSKSKLGRQSTILINIDD